MADRRTWTHEEIMDFISVAKKLKLVTESDRIKRNMDLFCSVQQDMEVLGHHFSIPQLRRKWKSLKETYYKLLGTLNKSGHSTNGLLWPYFHAMHEILASRPRCKSMQTYFGLDSGEEPLAQTLLETQDDAEVTMAEENLSPITTADSIPHIKNEICESSDNSMEAAPESPQCSSNLRTIHGTSKRAIRRRASAVPYQTDKCVESILEFMKESEQRQLQQFQLQHQSEQRYLDLLQQQASGLDGMMVSTLQTINNVATAILSTIGKNNSNSRTTSNLNNERVLETVSDKEPQCNLLEKHDSSTVVGNTADSRKELDELHVMKEKSHNSPDASVDKPPTEKSTEPHPAHILTTSTKSKKRSVHDSIRPANAETDSSKRRKPNSASPVSTTGMLLDDIKDLREEEKCASQTFFSSVADEAKKLPISRRVQFQAKVMSLLAETLDEPAV